MFGNTIEITYNAVAKTLTRINQDGYSSEYLLRDGTVEWRANIRHSTYVDRKRQKTVERHNMELITTVFAAMADGSDAVRKSYVVIENDRNDTVTNGPLIVDAFLSLINVDGTAEALFGWQS